jgi:CHAT domain-containing protein
LIGFDQSFVFVVDGNDARAVKLEISEDAAQAFGVEAGPLTSEKLRTALTIGDKSISELFKQAGSHTAKQGAAIDERMALLWKLLIPAEAREGLTQDKYKRLVVVPDGPLVNLPFDALVVDRKAGESKYLLDVGPPIISGPSATLLYNLSNRVQLEKGPGALTVLSVGDPTYATPSPSNQNLLAELTPRGRFSAYRGALSPLPYSGLEASWVAEQFNPVGLATKQLVKSAATEQAVRTNLAGRRIVHFACHGLADQTHGNLFGALAFTPGSTAQNSADDGFLTLAEIYGLNMQGCELAILSACETNLGPQQQGEGVFALSRGFLVAGARRVVASNWIVDDQSSASLVSVFCSLLAKQHKAGQPMDYAAALHEAKRWVRKQEKWKQPYYWGAFVLVGPG